MPPDVQILESAKRGPKNNEKLSLFTNVSTMNSPGSGGELKTAAINRNSAGPKLTEKPFTSLYERTMSLLAKLYSIPDFEFYLFPEGIDALVSGDTAPVIDPIAILWHCFRLGAPLCHLFNQLRPAKLLPVPDVSHLTSYTNICKKGIFHFLIAIKEELGLDDDQVFTISELYNDDMNKLVKVLNIVDFVLDKIKEKGYMPNPKSLPFSTSMTQLEASDNRSKSIAELLATERKYVESMQELMVENIDCRLTRKN